jgi:hypothetical protein
MSFTLIYLLLTDRCNSPAVAVVTETVLEFEMRFVSSAEVDVRSPAYLKNWQTYAASFFLRSMASRRSNSSVSISPVA